MYERGALCNYILAKHDMVGGLLALRVSLLVIVLNLTSLAQHYVYKIYSYCWK